MRDSTAFVRLACLLSLALRFVTSADAAEGDWPRFRGPNGAGVVEGVSFPSQWTEQDYLWQCELSGVGHSSPVVWQHQLFVTSANPETAELVVQALDTATGEERWSQRFASTPHRIHAANSFASSPPAVDRRHVYLLVASPESVQMVALTHDGDEVWRREMGPYRANHGFGISPMVVDDLVYCANPRPLDVVTDIWLRRFCFGLSHLNDVGADSSTA